MVDRKLAEKWVAALRSGEYRQGKGAMCVENKYCCLGVLAEIAWGDPYYKNAGEEIYVDFEELAIDGCRELGLDWNFSQELIMLNDGANGRAKNSFSEIADIIEKELLGEASEEQAQ